MCTGCGKSPDRAVTCSACNATSHCDSACQRRDWKGLSVRPDFRGLPHKRTCSLFLAARAEFRREARCGEALRTGLFSSWADQHHFSGAFFDSEFRARRGVLGGEEVGFRAKLDNGGAPYALTSEPNLNGFLNGAMLLRPGFPSLEGGWKVLREGVDFPSSPPRAPPPPAGIRCWQEYFDWRMLSGTSISPILLTNVLTVYQMLYHSLKIARPGKALTVYMLGAETELNQLPIFSELAYLLPGVCLRLVLISPAVKTICGKAAETPKRSVLKSAPDGLVLDVCAPAKAGGGRVCVQLDEREFVFSRFSAHGNTLPDAVVALNAGLDTYQTWPRAMAQILHHRVQYVFSDQTAFSNCKDHLESLSQGITMATGGSVSPPSAENHLKPFHGVVNRDIRVVSIPNINNGYIFHSI